MLKMIAIVAVVTSVAVLPGLLLVLVLLESQRNASLKRRRAAANVLKERGLYTQREIDHVLRVLAAEHLEQTDTAAAADALEEFNRIVSAARSCGFKVCGYVDCWL